MLVNPTLKRVLWGLFILFWVLVIVGAIRLNMEKENEKKIDKEKLEEVRPSTSKSR